MGAWVGYGFGSGNERGKNGKEGRDLERNDPRLGLIYVSFNCTLSLRNLGLLVHMDGIYLGPFGFLYNQNPFRLVLTSNFL